MTFDSALVSSNTCLTALLISALKTPSTSAATLIE
jgi:hypothetical protein